MDALTFNKELNQRIKSFKLGRTDEAYEIFLSLRPLILNQANSILKDGRKLFYSNIDEHMNNIYLELYTAITKFSLDKGTKFTYYAAVCVRNYFFNFIKTISKTYSAGDLIEEIQTEDFTEVVIDECQRQHENSILKKALNSLSSEKRKLIKAAYIDKKTLKDTAKELNISYSTARRWHKAALAEIRKSF